MLQNNFKLSQDEKVIMYVRRHWVFLVVSVVQISLLFLLPTICIWFLQFMGWIPSFVIFGVSFYSLTDVFVYMWGIICWLMLAERFTDYSLDFWLLTNKRIVESELVKLFDHKLSTLELQDIEDITIHSEGFWANYFDYGSLEVQTAGAVGEFHAPMVANPESVQRVMFDAKLKDEQERKDIEKGAVENIAHRIIKEDVEPENLSANYSHIPADQKVEPKNEIPKIANADNFDWAHVSESQKEDIRNLQAQIEEVESKYKKNVDDALRTE